ncbi:MAG: hypothetical protein J0H64_10185, partial [Actinobacteria bacterium]|nr:hypothetical protein [Actinomycetota bacterium]
RGEGAQEGSVDAASNSSQASWASAPAENGPESGDGTEEPYEHETPPETDEAASEQLSDDGFLPMAA